MVGIANNGPLGYAKSLVPSGMPVWLLPIMVPIEVLGMLVKPFALCIRLFANMIAGHVAILVFLAMIIMFKSYFLAPVSVFSPPPSTCSKSSLPSFRLHFHPVVGAVHQHGRPSRSLTKAGGPHG